MKTPARPGALCIGRAALLIGVTCIGLTSSTLWAAPTITTQPADATCAVGASAGFNVVATSSGGSLSYQWRLNGSDIGGANGSAISLGGVQKTDVGLYTCLVTDSNGSTLSSAGVLYLDTVLSFFEGFESGDLNNWLTINYDMSIETNLTFVHSGSYSCNIGNNRNGAYHNFDWPIPANSHFKASAWMYDDGNGYQDATDATQCTWDIRAYSGGAYNSGTNVLTLGIGKYFSAGDTPYYQFRTGLTNWYDTTITRSLGWHNFTIEVNAGTVTWYVDDAVAATQSGVRTDVRFDDETIGLGTVGVYMPGNAYIDDLYLLGYPGTSPANPTFGAQPVATATSANLNNPVTFTAAATAVFGQNSPDADPLSYQWLKNGAAISGATNTAYTLLDPQLSDAGAYSCVAFYTGGAAKSADAALTVTNLPPTIDSQNPTGTVTIDQGGTVTFSVTARASNPINCQWLKGTTVLLNGPNISGATSASVTLSNLASGDAGSYSCQLTNNDGTNNSAAVTLVVTGCPVINTQPSSVTNGLGSNVTFTVAAAGASLNYLWSKGSSPLSDVGRISGATSSSLAIATIEDGDAGTYTCTVSASGCPSVTTDPRTLTVVHQPISATALPAFQQVAPGNPASLTVTVTGGAAPFSYQWKKNGVAISGATDSALSWSSVGSTNTGNYACTVANGGGSVLSTSAALLVPLAWSDNFESYTINPLDKNKTGNSAPNGSGNPWWGTGGANLRVINTEYATPHNQSQSSNAKMVRSAYSSLGPSFDGWDQDLEFLNAAYRFNGGNRFYGDFMCEWWFYDLYGTSDAVDADGSIRRYDYYDEVSLCNYTSGLPTTTDYSGSPTAPGGLVQRLCIGACNALGTLSDTNYQVAIMGVSDGVPWGAAEDTVGGRAYNAEAKYFNTALVRSIGWHHARIFVGPADPVTHVATVQFFVDDMNKPQVTKTMPPSNVGFNAIEITTSWCASLSTDSAMGYFDDFAFRSATLEPWIVQQPVSLAVAAGQPATLSIVAACTNYQWKKDGVVISGANQSSYTIPAAGATNAGSYVCTVTGAAGSQDSSPAALNVINGTYGVGTGLEGDYFSDTTLTTFNASRVDPTVNFDGGSGHNFPGVSVGPSNFGARWIGSIQPGFSETYTFYTTSDDGVRLWVGGNLIIDQWVGQAPREWSGSIALNAGQTYPITLEYYQGTGGSMVNLRWESAHTPKDIVPTSALYPSLLTWSLYPGSGIQMTWWPPFTLQWGTNVAGPYEDVPGAIGANSYWQNLDSEPHRFFRLRY